MRMAFVMRENNLLTLFWLSSLPSWGTETWFLDIKHRADLQRKFSAITRLLLLSDANREVGQFCLISPVRLQCFRKVPDGHQGVTPKYGGLATFLGSASWLDSTTGVPASARTHPVGLVGPCSFWRRVQEGVRGSSGEALDSLKT